MPMRHLAAIFALPWLAVAQDGFRPVVGGLPFEAGLALGAEYRKSGLLHGPLEFRAKAIGSTKKYEYLEAGLLLPELASGLLHVGVKARYRNYPEEDFWGLGPKSSHDTRTDFRQEDISYAADFGVHLRKWIDIGVTGGAVHYNAGPGKDADHPSIEQRFTPGMVPALDRQPHYVFAGTFVVIDYRDETADPSSGGYYQFRWTQFHDRKFDRYSFGRYEVDLRQFVPSPGIHGTIAARLSTILDEKSPDQEIPFFLQPTAGGGGDLRGYHQYRFRDQNSLAANLEYRWRMNDFVQVVGFADAARVFERPGEFGFSGVRGSAGAGGRLKLGNFVLGADLGWSPDGIRLWFRGSHTF